MEVLAHLVLTHLVAQQEIDPGGKGAEEHGNRHTSGMLGERGCEAHSYRVVAHELWHENGEQRLDSAAPNRSRTYR